MILALSCIDIGFDAEEPDFKVGEELQIEFKSNGLIFYKDLFKIES